MIPQRKFGKLFAIAGLLFIAVLTLKPEYGNSKPPPSLCILCGDTSVMDAILNVLLFIPFGFGLRLAGMSRKRVFAIALVTTITVETAQLFIPGRDTSLGDVLTNSFGGLIGVWCADVWRVVLLPDRRMSVRFASGWTALFMAILAVSGVLARISLPDTTAWGVWEPSLLHHDTYDGTVIDATAGGLRTPNAISATSADVRRRLTSDSVVVRAIATGGHATEPIAAIATVSDWQRSQIFMLGERRGGLVFSLRLRTADARVANPAIRLDDVFPRQRASDAAIVAGGLIHHRLWVSAERGGVRREWSLPVDAGLGWSYLLPFEYEYGREAPWLTMLWIAGLALPAAYWARRAGARALVFASLAMALALLAVPFATRVHPTPWWEWLALAIGAGVGAALSLVALRGEVALAERQR